MMNGLASDKQLALIEKLLIDRQTTPEIEKHVKNCFDNLKQWRAAEIINELLSLPKRVKATKICYIRRCNGIATNKSPFHDAKASLCPRHFLEMSNLFQEIHQND